MPGRGKTIVIPEKMANATNRVVLGRYDLSIPLLQKSVVNVRCLLQFAVSHEDDFLIDR
jgi:hypothetical protein